jgi:hypothetical protein
MRPLTRVVIILLSIVIAIAVFILLLLPAARKVTAGPALTASPHPTDGIAVYLLLDVSGSMDQHVPNAAGASEAKLAIAKRAGIAVCRQIAQYAHEKPASNIRLAIASFSDTCRTVLPLDRPDPAAAETAINALGTHNRTAIGSSVLQAQQELDRTGLRQQHILIITDGENNVGPSPDKVAAAINQLPEDLRPSVYVIAFDVNAVLFAGVKAQGWQVYPAANGKELAQQLDAVVGGHILAEQPLP